jgi:hypothetical protein
MPNKCKFKECKTRPSYNFEEESKPIYCNRHKLENMINVISKKM